MLLRPRLATAATAACSSSSSLQLCARSFLPGLGQIVDRRRTQKWQKVVPHPTATIYRAVSEVESYAAFLPWCTRSQVLTRSVDETGSGELRTEITVGFQSLTSKFRSRVDLTPLQRVHAESEANEYIEHLSFTWDFGALGDQACRLDLKLGECCCAPSTFGLIGGLGYWFGSLD